MKVLELFLSGSFALLVLDDGLGDRFDGSVSDGDEDSFFAFTDVFLFVLSFPFGDVFFGFPPEAYLALDNLVLLVVISMFFFVVEAVFGIKEIAPHESLIRSHFGSLVIVHHPTNYIYQTLMQR